MGFATIFLNKIINKSKNDDFVLKFTRETTDNIIISRSKNFTYLIEYFENTDSVRKMLMFAKETKISKEMISKYNLSHFNIRADVIWADEKINVINQEDTIEGVLLEMKRLYDLSQGILNNKTKPEKVMSEQKKEVEKKEVEKKEVNNNSKIKILKDFKLSRIYLKEINQFYKFEVDLTYPKGHKKEGKPLDKVCLIGQNGTGKTSIIRIIKAFIEQNTKSKILEESKTSIELDYTDFSNKTITHTYYINKFNEVKLEQNFINFPADMLSVPNKENRPIPTSGIIDFDILSAQKTWEFIKKNIIEYNKQEKIEREKILKNALKATSEELLKITTEFNNWKEKNHSPVEKLADECLDRFFEKFNLKVKTKIDFEEESDINYLKIENLQKQELGNLEEVLSSGTKQVLHTAMPLYSLKPENAIVIFDEPERSLYPDIQKEIVDFYTSLSPKSQFFFATHSPIIASAFEPWEIVEIRFDSKTGKIKQELWYDTEKQRHVDNYFKDPRYLSWDDILMKIYGMKEDGNSERIEKLMEVASLKSKLEKGNFSSEEEKQQIFKEFKKLSKLVNFKFRDEKNK